MRVQTIGRRALGERTVIRYGAWGLLLGAALALAGCASTVPSEVRSAPEPPLSRGDVVDDPEGSRGADVRWGGRIVAVRHEEEATWIEVVQRPLERRGRPQDVDRSDGRFLARFDGFLEPSIYTSDRLLTVRGSVLGVRDGRVGEFRYDYPVVEARAHHLWAEREPPPRRHYDPWYDDPWYPGHPWSRRPRPYW